ncbi:MAG: transglutaminase family protein [Proteobacteria bacterium]|nr:transglutaminase family protein [Pseudomonadota bacterium]
MNIDPRWLAPTRFLDYQSPEVQDFVRAATGDAQTPRDRAVCLYYAVRDRIRYDPYRFTLNPEVFMASNTVREKAAYCVPKALLYAACLRAAGIPARPGFADVRNHLTTRRLLEVTGSDVFSWHGYVALLLDGRWVKATPAFNIEMCQRFQVLPLEFDGTADSLMHPYNALQQRHMEYIQQHGEFDDLPYQLLVEEMQKSYPQLIAASEGKLGGDFEHEAIHTDP